MNIREIVGFAPVIPVLTITDLEHAVPLARALTAGGLRVLEITLRTPGQESQFIGTIIPTGAGIRLSDDATSLVTGPWQTARELEIKVAEGGAPIDGVVALSGLPKALQSLNAECAQK